MSARDEAARWFSVLHRGVMTLEEHAEYERWVAARGNRAALARMEQLWNGLDGGADGPRFSRKVMVAAICAASLGLVLLSWSSHPGPSGFWTSLDWANR